MPVAAGLHLAPTTGYRRHEMASASGQPLPDYPVVQNPGMENWTQGHGGQWTQRLPGGVTGVANIDYAPGYGPNQPGGWGNIGQPGFTPGGPDDPANGGTGYYNGGGMLNPPVQNPGMPMPGGPGTPIDGGTPGHVVRPAPQGSFQGLAKGTMGGVRDLVQSGSMGRAKAAFEAGGGTWSKDVSRRLRNKYG